MIGTIRSAATTAICRRPTSGDRITRFAVSRQPDDICDRDKSHLGRGYLKGRAGDAANVILTAVGYNLRLVLAWLRALPRLILDVLLPSLAIPSPLKPGILTADDLHALHRVRERLVSQRTGITQIRAFLLERGIAVRQGGRGDWPGVNCSEFSGGYFC